MDKKLAMLAYAFGCVLASLQRCGKGSKAAIFLWNPESLKSSLEKVICDRVVSDFAF